MRPYYILTFFLAIVFWETTSAQISIAESFNDSNFTVQPHWQGDTADFFVNTNKQLQTKTNVLAATKTLVIRSSIIDSASWEFYIKLNFDPSNSNFARVYLSSNKADLTTSLNGYFVQIGGQSGTVDEVSLYQQNGISISKLIDGANGTVGISPTLKVRVVKDLNHGWELFIDTSAALTNYVSQGTAIDSSIRRSGFFGVYCKYSSSRSDDFFFDDFNINGYSFRDQIRPEIKGIRLVDSIEVELVFSEKLNATSALNASNYAFDQGVGNPDSVYFIDPDSSIVSLRLSKSLINGTEYQLRYENIQDSSGNSILTDSIAFSYLIPQKAKYRDIVINEFYPDFNPTNGLPEAEFVELFNASDKIIQLSNWTLSDASSTVSLDSMILKSGEFIVLCNKSDEALFSTYGSVMGLSSLPSLNNTGDQIQIEDNQNEVIDVLNYTQEWYNDPSKTNGGYSIEQINPFTDCTGKDNFRAAVSTIGGTPSSMNSVLDTFPDNYPPINIGYEFLSRTELLLFFNELLDSNSVNSARYKLNGSIGIDSAENRPPLYTQIKLKLSVPIDSGVINQIKIVGLTDCEGNLLDSNRLIDIILPAMPEKRDVVINEFFSDFSPSVGLPESEFIELYNRSNKIFDLKDWEIDDLTGGGTLSQRLFYPGEFLILVDPFDTSDYLSYGLVMGVSSFPSLNNGGDLIEFKDSRGFVVDDLTYTIDWYRDESKQSGGYTIEQINPLTDCTGKNNFRASSNGNGGTPGTQNAVFDSVPDLAGPVLESVDVVAADSLLLHFNERLDPNTALTANYIFSSTAMVAIVEVQKPDLSSILLILNNDLDSGIIHRLTVSNLNDCGGNTIAAMNPIEIVVPGVPGNRSVVINEFYVDFSPSNGLPESEYIELYNSSNETFNLKDWTLGDKTTLSTLGNHIFQPGEYLIVCDIGSEAAFSGFGVTQGQNRFPSLNNGGDQLFLRDLNGKLIDQVTYTDNWYKDETKKGGGYSLEQINPNRPCSGEINFIASNAIIGGTPGTVNSTFNDEVDREAPIVKSVFVIDQDTLEIVFNEPIDTSQLNSAMLEFSTNNTSAGLYPIFPELNRLKLKLSNPLDSGVMVELLISQIEDCYGNAINEKQSLQFALPEAVNQSDVVINEILFNPRTGGSDFVELYNRSNKILSLNGWSFANNEMGQVSNVKTITEEAILFFPGMHLAFSENIENIRTEYPLSEATNLIQLADLPAYNDDEGTVILVDNFSNTIDLVVYNQDYQISLLENVNGVSLERIHPDGSSRDKNNFHSAAEAVGFATPGYQNSQFSAIPSFGGEIKIQPEVFSPDQDGFDDVLFINYQFDTPGFIGTLRIFDQEGRLVKTIANSELLATSGRYSWDGTNNNSEKSRIGIYVLFFEVFNTAGDTKSFKEPIVLGGRLD